MEINVYKVLNTNVAISEIQANNIKKEIDYNSKEIVLDFEKITDVTTAFMNVILDGFFPLFHNYQELLGRLKIKNSNQAVEFAFGDSYKLFKARYGK